MAASLPRTTPIKILYTLWALLTAALVLDTADDLASLANLAPRPYQEPAPLQLPPNYNPFLAEQLRQQRLSREQERFRQDQFAAMQDVGPLAFHFVCNLWALLGSVGLAAVRFNWGRWSVRRRVLYGGFALAFVLGRPLVGWLSIVMTLIPPGSILGWLVLVAAPPTLLWLAGLLQIILIAALIGAVFAVLVGVPATLFNQILQFEIAAQVFRHKQAGLVGYIVRFGYWLSGEVMPEIPDDTRGARLATPEEATAKNDPRGLSYGWMSGLPLYLYTEKHILIQASTRSGKGTAIILPHLLHYRGSIFCIDPKGENAKASGRFRELVNDKTHYIDPFGLTGKTRSRFNPMRGFNPDNMEAASKALAGAFIIPGEQETSHWVLSARQLLALCILWVYLSKDIPPDKKDMVTVRRVLLSGLKEMLQDCTRMDSPGNLLSDVAQSFLQTPEKEFGSIASQARRNTEILDNPYIAACLAADGEGEEVDFNDWRRGTMSVFACLSAPKLPAFNRLVRLLLTAGLDTMTDRMDPPDLPVSFVLDEVATLGRLEALENAVGLTAGYGLKLIYVFQDKGQMVDLYKGRWSSFVSNAGIRAIFNLDDHETAEYWSRTMGNHYVDVTSRNQNVYGITNGGSVKEEGRRLMSPEEIELRFADGQMLILQQGSRPIVTDRVPYFIDPGLEGLWDDPRYAVPEIPAPVLPRDRPTPEQGNLPLDERQETVAPCEADQVTGVGKPTALSAS